VTLEKKLRTEAEIISHNQLGAGDSKISVEDLARTLMVNGMVRIGDGERLKVVTA
jgi:LEA14-like dessication related protein